MTSPTCRIVQMAALAAALLTSACITPGDPYFNTYSSTGFGADRTGPATEIGRWVPVEPGRARVAITQAGSQEALAGREMRTTQGELVQTLTLANNTAVPGDNQITAAFDYGPASIFQTDIYAPKVGRYRIGPENLGGILNEVLPRANILGAPQIRQNRYGLYGFVAAEYPGQAQCVLAWQVLDGPSGAPRRTGIQMRLCDAHAQAADLIAPFDTLRLDM